MNISEIIKLIWGKMETYILTILSGAMYRHELEYAKRLVKLGIPSNNQ